MVSHSRAELNWCNNASAQYSLAPHFSDWSKRQRQSNLPTNDTAGLCMELEMSLAVVADSWNIYLIVDLGCAVGSLDR